MREKERETRMSEKERERKDIERERKYIFGRVIGNK
jgi:hypothetical protein